MLLSHDCISKNLVFNDHWWAKFKNQKLESNLLRFLNKLNIRQQYEVNLSFDQIFDFNVTKTVGFPDFVNCVNCDRIKTIRLYLTTCRKCFALFS